MAKPVPGDRYTNLQRSEKEETLITRGILVSTASPGK